MRVVFVWIVSCLLGAAPAFAQLSSQLVVSGFSLPVAVVQDPTQPNVQFVVEQGGKIRVVRDGVLLPTAFLDITPLVLSGGEQGLLGLAFAPDYATSRRFFVNYTRQPDGHTVISRYQRSVSDPVQANPASRFDLRWPGGNTFILQPFANHNGGDLQFGSDGFLYIPLGDGGAANDPAHRAQNRTELLGKMLRIDVNVSDADAEGYDVPGSNPFVLQAGTLPEIWAFGLRNPFRVTVDAISRGGNGAIVIGDVGQNAWEEIDYEPFGAGGRNYGWSVREGAHVNVNAASTATAFTPLVEPIAEYSHSVGNVITGGVVNRGTGLGLPFWGRYFFADFGAKRIWSIGLTIDPTTHEATAGVMIEHTAALGGSATIGNVSAFGIAANCDVLFLNYAGGELRRIVNNGNPSGCPTSPDPFLASGGGVFTNGTWFTRDHPSAAGAGLAGLSASGPSGACVTDPPASDWVCINGGWVPPGHPLARGRDAQHSESARTTITTHGWKQLHDDGSGTGLGLCQRRLGAAGTSARVDGATDDDDDDATAATPNAAHWRRHHHPTGPVHDRPAGPDMGVRERRLAAAEPSAHRIRAVDADATGAARAIAGRVHDSGSVHGHSWISRGMRERRLGAGRTPVGWRGRLSAQQRSLRPRWA